SNLHGAESPRREPLRSKPLRSKPLRSKPLRSKPPRGELGDTTTERTGAAKMEAISAIITALALGAAGALKDVAGQGIKDAYAGLKALIQRNYAQVPLAQLEANPDSKACRDVIEEELTTAGAVHDEEFLQHVKVGAAGPYTCPRWIRRRRCRASTTRRGSAGRPTAGSRGSYVGSARGARQQSVADRRGGGTASISRRG